MVSSKNIFRILTVANLTVSCGKDDEQTFPKLDFRQAGKIYSMVTPRMIQPAPAGDRDFRNNICDVAKNNGKVVLTTDYCSGHTKMDDSYTKNESKGYISFAADHRELDNIPVYGNDRSCTKKNN